MGRAYNGILFSPEKEGSTNTGYNVDETFELLVRMMMEDDIETEKELFYEYRESDIQIQLNENYIE